MWEKGCHLFSECKLRASSIKETNFVACCGVEFSVIFGLCRLFDDSCG